MSVDHPPQCHPGISSSRSPLPQQSSVADAAVVAATTPDCGIVAHAVRYTAPRVVDFVERLPRIEACSDMLGGS